MPGKWQEQIGGQFTQLLLVKLLREEKLVFAAQQYVAAELGKEFTEPKPWTLDNVFQETSARTPIIFILSTGMAQNHRHSASYSIDPCSGCDAATISSKLHTQRWLMELAWVQ